MEPTEKHLAILKKFFGHKEFRPMQWTIIRSILEDKRDNCVIMATGYGKSLCYQYPPVFCEGLGIVISPLISLMQDQVLSLKMRNIPACFLGSAQTEKSLVEDQLLNGEIRLVYATPEWCSGDHGENILRLLKSKGVNVTLIAIDEAHCVSQWGHDFRKSYRTLGRLHNVLPGVPIIALTATATPQVRADIISSICLRNPQQICTSFDRPNLFLSASIKGPDVLSDLKFIINRQRLENNSCGSTIIYCPTKKIADKVYTALRVGGFKCNMYHAGLSAKVRASAHDEFVKDIVEIMIATVAFGMGIDKPDVRTVIHYGSPKDLESYYQEIGRAGRDGLPALCHTFYAQTDFSLNRTLISSYSGEFRNHKEDMARLMEKYLQTADCRRRIILKHFTPKDTIEDRDSKECCDNCVKNNKKEGRKQEIDYDLTEDALLLLNAVNELSEKYGLMMYIQFLRGSNNQRLPKRYHSSSLFGKGRFKTEPWWKLLGGLLVRESLLEETISNFGLGWKNNFPLKILKISNKGRLYLKNEGKTAYLEPTPEMLTMLHKIPRKTNDGWYETKPIFEEPVATAAVYGDTSSRRDVALEDELFEELLKFRSTIAGKLKCMPYMVLDNRSIQDLTVKKPKTLEELSLVEGINDAKIKNFGKECLDCIARVSANHSEAGPSLNKPTITKRFMKNFVFKPAAQKLSYDNVDDNKNEDLKEIVPESLKNEQDESMTGPLEEDKSETTLWEENLMTDNDLLAIMDAIEMKEATPLEQPSLKKEDNFSLVKRKRPEDEASSPDPRPASNTTSITVEDMVKINSQKKKFIKKKIKL